MARAGYIGLIAAAMLAISPGAPAQDVVALPFTPTLGAPLHLHSERHVTRGGAAEDVDTTEEDLVFAERNAAGYLLRWTSRAGTIRTDPARQPIMESVLAATLGKTAVIQTDSQGAPISVANLAEMRAMLGDALDRLVAGIATQFAARAQADRDAIAAAVTQIADGYRGMTDDQLTDLLLEDPRRLFGWGGTTLRRGAPQPYATKATVPAINMPLDVTGQVALREAGPGGIVIEVSSTSDPATVKAAVAAYFDRIIGSIAPTRQAEVGAAIAKLEGFAAKETLLVTLDPQTGLPRAADYRRTIGIAGQEGVETKRYALTR